MTAVPFPPPSRFMIDAVLPRLFAILRTHRAAALQAPAGAGKTLRVPTALLDQPWLPGHRIIVVQPHGLAARAAASRMAALLGEEVGRTVGLRIPSDERIGSRTRIEMVAGDLFLRQIQASPELRDVGAVLFDSFREPSVSERLALAFAWEAREALCGNTLLMTMSEPADTASAVALLGDGEGPVPVAIGEGSGFPVEVRHLGHTGFGARPAEEAAERVAEAVRRILGEEPGGILAFLPDDGAIRRAAALLDPAASRPDVVLIPLCDDPPPDLLDDALAPAPPGTRKLVLASPLAETGLGIADVRIVVDCGLTRKPLHEPRCDMACPATLPAGLDVAERRAAAAGRREPGVCYRLWPAVAHAGMAPCPPPESPRVDPAPLALELAAWGVRDGDALPWALRPPADVLGRGRALLRRLEAIGADGRITPLGERMARLGLHPRLARLILAGAEMGLGGLACTVAAQLADGEPPDAAAADLRPWVGQLLAEEHGAAPSGVADRHRIARLLTRVQLWRRWIGVHQPVEDDGCDRVGDLLALAYPDRVARRVSTASRGCPARYRLAEGGSASLPDGDPLSAAEWLGVAILDGPADNRRIALAAPLSKPAPHQDPR